MATRARLCYVLSDDSIVSVYHHWDGYPEWLGVTLNEHYNTDSNCLLYTSDAADE